MLGDLDTICFSNLLNYWQSFTKSKPGSLIDTNDYLFIDSGATMSLMNPVFLKNLASTLPIVRGDKYSLWYDTKRNKAISMSSLAILEPLMQSVPVMVITLEQVFKEIVPPEITINVLNHNNDLKDWIIPVKTSFMMNCTTTLRYQTCLEQAGDQFIHFIAKKSGQTVGVASLFLHDKIAGFYNLSVLPEYRKQGIGSALHIARLLAAQKRGYKQATLQVTPIAISLANKMGFKTLSELLIYRF